MPLVRAHSTSTKVASVLAENRLGIPAVAYFALAMGAPLTILVGAVSPAYANARQLGIPLAFVLMGTVLGLFSVGYVAMASRVPNAGAFNAYVSKGLGRPLGVAVGWISVVAYGALQIGFFGALGDAAQPVFRAWFGLDLAWWVYSLAGWVVVACLGLQYIDLNGKVLALLLIAECLVIVVYSAANLANPARGTAFADGLAVESLFAPGAGTLFAIAILGFVGFETTAVFGEETRSARRTVPIATFLSLGVLVLLYVLGSWSMSVAVGPDRIADVARGQGTNLMFDLAAANLGGWAAEVGRLLYITGVLAALIAFHNTAARYAFSLGRERLLPAFLGRTSQRTNSPRNGSLAQSAVSGLVIGGYAVAGGDPVRDLFFIWSTTGSIGVLLLIATTAIAVVVFFARVPSRRRARPGVVVPVLACLGCLLALVLVLSTLDSLLEVDGDSPLRWGIPAFYLGIAVLGVGWGLVLRRRRPAVYAMIGLGTMSASGTGLGQVGHDDETRPRRRYAGLSQPLG
ncbi:APC family permease [Allokutzneria sp. A3M-2-11 16]|uniref:APC family permease n=1 Tax=Allokutzneria sp. A3M-2-11 16 TaxID=2962043 RepID=UPI0020B6D4B8|nr:APC family permease [Allokutzneria sp. A3M-2-11 16]MCP3805073.1 APC family permease [Allokutzneria sp. A3M-2-11 16]